jgi:plasmid stability protein
MWWLENGGMKTILELPDDVLAQIQLRALREGKDLKDELTDLLRKALALDPVQTGRVVVPDQANLERRREVAAKFISGEWGANLSEFEAGRAADRAAARARAEVWSE